MFLSWLDAALACLGIGSAAVLAARMVLQGTQTFQSRVTGLVVYILVALSFVAFIGATRRLRRPTGGLLLRCVFYPSAAFLIVATVDRLGSENYFVPPVSSDTADFGLFESDERALWALRLMLHSRGSRTGTEPPTIPASWPFPADVQVAVGPPTEGGQVMATAVRPNSRFCAVSVASLRGKTGLAVCRDRNQGDSLRFTPPVRMTEHPLTDVRRASGGDWLQYRHDATRTAAADSGTGATWSATLAAGARSNPSIVGGLVLIGTHGAGSLEAYSVVDGALRWRAYAPNWIHQDAVSDGSTVLVGFGDSNESLWGRAPGGVATFDLETGSRRWTAFEASSVMTSPVIIGNRIAYVTSRGVARVRNLSDGALLSTTQLPGQAVMAPPVARGDTIVVTLDPNGVCAIEVSGRILWCVKLPGVMQAGHAAATLAGDTVFVSARASPNFRNYVMNFRSLRPSDRFLWFASWVTTNLRSHFDAQRVEALALPTGSRLWESQDFFRRLPPEGHIAGTAAVDDSVIAINLPIADTLIVLDRRSLVARWSVRGGGARGPVLLSGGRLYVIGRSGAVRVYRVSDGLLLCDTQWPGHFDRAGPSLAHGTLFAASIEGRLLAVNKADADRCRAVPAAP